jgi:SAM-dependent methyltransferase
MSAYAPKKYWSSLAEGFRSADAFGFAPVLHPMAPPWFNQLIDGLQFRALRRALAIAALHPGARVLDVGCGTGRWIRRFGKMGFQPIGMDATLGMLDLARDRAGAGQLAAGMSQQLPFADASFDCVSDVTVVQHIPARIQPLALREMIRVLKPGGCLILFELIRGKDGHIFPRSPQNWIDEAESCGVRLTSWFGQEFLLFDRAFVGIAQATRGNSTGSAPSVALTDPPTPRPSSTERRLYWQLRHITMAVSSWSEPLAGKICPHDLATHGVFIFRK